MATKKRPQHPKHKADKFRKAIRSGAAFLAPNAIPRSWRFYPGSAIPAPMGRKAIAGELTTSAAEAAAQLYLKLHRDIPTAIEPAQLSAAVVKAKVHESYADNG